MSAAVRLAELHQALERIGAAMERGEIESLPPMLDAYSRAVGEFCALEGAAGLRDGVQALQARQQEVIAAMRHHQDRLLALMCRQRTATRAVHAYTGAGAG